MMETAYYAAVVPHMKNPPKLKDLLVNPTDAPRRKQSWEQMKAALAIALG